MDRLADVSFVNGGGVADWFVAALVVFKNQHRDSQVGLAANRHVEAGRVRRYGKVEDVVWCRYFSAWPFPSTCGILYVASKLVPLCRIVSPTSQPDSVPEESRHDFRLLRGGRTAPRVSQGATHGQEFGLERRSPD